MRWGGILTASRWLDDIRVTVIASIRQKARTGGREGIANPYSRLVPPSPSRSHLDRPRPAQIA